MKMLKIYLYICLLMNLITLVFYIIDKIKAIRHSWRIKESVLLFMTFFGGAIGALIGINIVRHKNRHWYFHIVSIVGLITQLTILGLILLYFN